MNITATGFDDLFIIEPKVFEDRRGSFFESFNLREFQKAGLDMTFVQDNQSHSRYGALRGMHFQKAQFAQTKLVRVLSGEIQDVVIDLRPGKPTFEKWFSINLSAQNRKQLLIPKGFAHGFLVLSEEADVLYKCDSFYEPGSEAGILYNDPSFNIQWQLPQDKMTFSDKDLKYSPYGR